MTGAEKAKLRVRVAKDVLQTLKGNMMVRRGTGYLFINNSEFQKIKEKISNRSSKKIAGKIKNQNCTVCALGACFLSLVSLDNEFNFDQDMDLSTKIGWENSQAPLSKSLFKRLLKVFSLIQLFMIEAAFETYHIKQNTRAILKATRFCENLYSFHPPIVLEAIMKNIIKNEGTFKP